MILIALKENFMQLLMTLVINAFNAQEPVKLHSIVSLSLHLICRVFVANYLVRDPGIHSHQSIPTSTIRFMTYMVPSEERYCV